MGCDSLDVVGHTKNVDLSSGQFKPESGLDRELNVDNNKDLLSANEAGTCEDMTITSTSQLGNPMSNIN